MINKIFILNHLQFNLKEKEIVNMKEGVDIWVSENFNDVYKMNYKVKKTLYSKESNFQKIDVILTEHLGKVLFNDGLLMTSERDEFVYHEMIAHVPMSSHPNPETVLIVGGGDGGTAREVLKHDSVKELVMVEIDPCVIEACKEHIKLTSCELDNPRLELIVEDGLKYVKETTKKFDIILVDSTDPIGPAAPLFDVAFYSDVKACLRESGIVVSQCEGPFLALEMQKKLLAIKAKLFDKTAIYNYSNITYPGGLWSFSFASKTQDPILDAKPLSHKISKGLKYYNQQLHKAAFALPQFQKNELKKYLK